MPCTTILVGKKASNDGSTMIARTDDGFYDVKKTIVVEPKDQPRKYKTVISHLEIDLPEEPMRYTSCPSVDPKRGVWPATGINAANVGMTATETITTNPRVLAADPLVRYKKAEKRGQKDIPGGIGEEDICLLVLPYIRSAREGVLRLGSLLEKYGTYETNGIAFNDADEIWWLESIGGHHWIAQKIKDEEVVIMPNQFGLDRFDFDDAYGEKKENLCSADLKEFVEKNHLDLNNDGTCNPRLMFGSQRDHDHIYNTPRAWYLGRFLNPTIYKWDGPDADFTPESNDIPWSFIPERKITAEDVKYLLSTHYQGTDYDPYDPTAKYPGKYRSIGINRTGVMAICQIRGWMPRELQGIEWICYGPTTYDTVLPIYTNVSKIPAYLSKVTTDVSTDNFYWQSRLLAALCDPYYNSTSMAMSRYEQAVVSQARSIIAEYDEKMTASGKFDLMEEANEKICAMAKKETTECLNGVLLTATQKMKDGFSRPDN